MEREQALRYEMTAILRMETDASRTALELKMDGCVREEAQQLLILALNAQPGSIRTARLLLQLELLVEGIALELALRSVTMEIQTMGMAEVVHAQSSQAGCVLEDQLLLRIHALSVLQVGTKTMRPLRLPELLNEETEKGQELKNETTAIQQMAMDANQIAQE
jgi:hypothetical protein